MVDQIWRMTETVSNAYVVFPPFVSSEAFIGPGWAGEWMDTHAHSALIFTLLMGLGQ